MIRASGILVTFLMGVPGHGQAQCGTSFVEGFEHYSNEGSWVWSGTFQVLSFSGGNPAWHVLSEPLFMSAPRFSSNDPLSQFGGDWRARGVTSTGIDVRTHDAPMDGSSRPLALLLFHDNGTPGDPSDDPFVYTLAGQVPPRDGNWHSFTADVPAASSTMPAGWNAGTSWPGGADALWNQVITSVHRVVWHFGDPILAFQPANFRFAADNVRLAFQGGASTYCISQQNSVGCSPAIWGFGAPSATQPQTFLVLGMQVINQSAGMLVYGFAPVQAPLFGGYACIAQPVRRTAVLGSGGSTQGTDCSGLFLLDFNAHIQSGIDPLLVAGATVYAQFWSRDAQAPHGSSLSNALRFTICP